MYKAEICLLHIVLHHWITSPEFFLCRQMFSHYSNMYPQLLKDETVLNPLKRFLRYSLICSRSGLTLRLNQKLV